MKKSISITTHIDCDGLASGSIITKALIRAGANCTVRTSKEFSSGVIDSLKKDSRDFHIVTDLGGGFAKNLWLEDRILRGVGASHHAVCGP